MLLTWQKLSSFSHQFTFTAIYPWFQLAILKEMQSLQCRGQRQCGGDTLFYDQVVFKVVLVWPRPGNQTRQTGIEIAGEKVCYNQITIKFEGQKSIGV